MSKNPSFSQPTGPLSVGNVVSAALRIYRDRFKLYYGLAFTAYLWILVPIYGWAKFSAISALISRLVFSELHERPETVNDARRHVNPRMWRFLWAGILVSLIFFGIALVVSIGFGLLVVVLGAILGQNSTAIIIVSLLTVIAVLVFLVVYIRLISRLFIVEVPLAIENNMTANSAISRSWQLTEGFVGRLQWIVFVSFLITLPISIVVQIVTAIIQLLLGALFSADSPIFGLLYLVLVLAISLASGALLIPFWQAVKAVIYYDLRSRREGLGLNLRDNN